MGGLEPSSLIEVYAYECNLNAVQEYLFERGMTAVDLLSGAIEPAIGDQEPPSTQQNPETTDDDVRRCKRPKGQTRPSVQTYGTYAVALTRDSAVSVSIYFT